MRGTWGIFTKDVEIRLTEYGVVVSQTEGLATEDCDATAWDDGQIESKCADSKNHKCKTRKAFAVFVRNATHDHSNPPTQRSRNVVVHRFRWWAAADCT